MSVLTNEMPSEPGDFPGDSCFMAFVTSDGDGSKLSRAKMARYGRE